MHTEANVTQFFWLLLAAFVVALVAKRFRVPYALALVATGLLIGATRLMPKVHLDPGLMFAGFLPPLLFESAIQLRVDPLLRNWKPIAIYTVAGTIASTFIVGGLTAWALGMSFKAGLVFGALISPTDPISVIAIFKRLGAGRRLTLIVEAESLFNDVLAVVLLSVMVGLAAGGRFSVAGSLWQFFRLAAGGALLGAAIGSFASRIHYQLDDHLVEITLTTVVAFGSYLSAEALHVSGVMAVVAAGLVIGNYGMPNTMSPGTRLAVAAFWEYAVFVVNSIVFLLIGIEVCYVPWTHRILWAVGAVASVLVGRAAIYPISWLVNRLGVEIPRSWQHVMVWGGLRGALSMALVLGLAADFPRRDALVAGTFAVVLFSLLVQGSTIGKLLKRLRLSGAITKEPKDQRLLAGEIVACQAALYEIAQFRAKETHPNWAIEMLAQQYRLRLRELEDAMEAADPSYMRRRTEQAYLARVRALSAQKSSLQESVQEGRLEAEDWADLRERIDAELAELAEERAQV